MRNAILILTLWLFSVSQLHAADTSLHIIPEPVRIIRNTGTMLLGNTYQLKYDHGNTSVDSSAVWLRSYLQRQYDCRENSKSERTIQLSLVKKLPETDSREAYRLTVTAKNIRIEATDPAGIFYGIQTLIQVIPLKENKNTPIRIPAVQITDYPRFGWRGLMLDVSRHFFTKEEVKRYIDEMARYKYNTFHWHLTDDNGWRIEIKSLPELTSKGAWRVERTGRWGTFQAPQPDEPTPYGGYYTQDDIREVIQYAADRHITILPEIDVPGHSLAMITAYPNLSTTKKQYSVNPGSKFYKIDDNVLSPAVDSVYLILDKVFSEIAALFPNPYIHVGGDEAYKGFWEKDPACLTLMQKLGLKDGEALQSYFIIRMQKILKAHGKKLIGWDEILQGGLAPEATVMSWRGMEGGIKAAKMNHHVVMTPWDYVYLDLYQGDPVVEPATYGMCRLSDSYNYDPVPDSVDEKYILGGQGNLWTESVPNYRHAQYMTWPRSLALSEVYWSPKDKRDWNRFTAKLPETFARMDDADIKYARSAYDAVCVPKLENDSTVSLSIKTEIPDLAIYYTFDYTNPDPHYPRYNGVPLLFPKGADQINIVTYKDGQQVGKQINIKKDELIKRAKAQRHVY